MTWHAARFLLTEFFLLLIAAAAFFLFWTMPHRGHHCLRRLKIRSELRLAIGLVIVIVSAFLFIHILRGVLHDATLAEADLRIHTRCGCSARSVSGSSVSTHTSSSVW